MNGNKRKFSWIAVAVTAFVFLGFSVKSALAMTKEQCKAEGGAWVVNKEGKGFCYKTLGRMAYVAPLINKATAEKINAEFSQLSRLTEQKVVEQKVQEILRQNRVREIKQIKVKRDAGWGILVVLPQGVIIHCAGGDPLKGLNIGGGSGGGGGPCFSAKEVGIKEGVK